MSESAVFNRLRRALDKAGIAYQHMHHAPVYTSEEASAVRGVPLHSGAKALILKVGDDNVMAVMPADLILDSRGLRSHLGARRMRFATREEVLALTTLTPGSIPPFGSLFGLKTYCDERLADNENINFNAGSHTESFRLAYADYIRYEMPELAVLAMPAMS